MARFVLGVSGASGQILALKALHTLLSLGHQVELVLSRPALLTAAYELGQEYGKTEGWLHSLSIEERERVTLHKVQAWDASIASGSCKTDGMLLLPCSMATLAALACGLSDNLLRRAADVHLKERRPLVIVPREAPLSSIHLENMLKLSQAGAILFPPQPFWYLRPHSLIEMEEELVGRILDSLGVELENLPRWGSQSFPKQEIVKGR